MSRLVAFGEIMGRFVTPGYQRFQQAMPGTLHTSFAGAEATIASSYAYLGGSAAFVTALPQHAIADACVASLRIFGVDTSHIVRTDSGRLGLYFLEQGANQRPTTVIYDRDGSSVSITPATAYDWNTILEGADWFITSGITPALSQNAAAVTKTALQEASKRGVKIAIDMNFRQKLWKWDPALSARELATKTMRDLLPFADLFIGGAEDAAAMVGAEPSTPPENLARQLTEAFPRLNLVAMTRREGVSASQNLLGGFLYERQTQIAYLAPANGQKYSIQNIVDRIGTGDAFTAALLYALTRPELARAQCAVEFATAAACLAHSIEGDQNFTTRSEVEALLQGDSSGRVQR
ncbi:MAG: sugar kinase [Verrucomicrobiota bacterium]